MKLLDTLAPNQKKITTIIEKDVDGRKWAIWRNPFDANENQLTPPAENWYTM